MKHTDTSRVWMDILILEGHKVWMVQDPSIADFNSMSYAPSFKATDPEVGGQDLDVRWFSLLLEAGTIL
jgi:hypothetical protein